MIGLLGESVRLGPAPLLGPAGGDGHLHEPLGQAQDEPEQGEAEQEGGGSLEWIHASPLLRLNGPEPTTHAPGCALT